MTNRLLSLYTPEESYAPEYDHPDLLNYAADIKARGPQQEPAEGGRLPTLEERSGGNPVKGWWLSQGDKMREQAAKPQGELWRQFLVGALQAPAGTRGGYQVRYTRDTPDPFLLPGGGGKYGGQPLLFDGGGRPGLWQGITPLLGARAGQTKPEDEIK